LFFAADLTALHWSIRLTSAANAILFLNAQPLYVVFGAWLLFGERVTALFVVGAATAMAGAVLMLGESAQFGGGRLLGDGLGIVAGICYAGYILSASRLRARKSSAVINTWTCLIACLPAAAGGRIDHRAGANSGNHSGLVADDRVGLHIPGLRPRIYCLGYGAPDGRICGGGSVAGTGLGGYFRLGAAVGTPEGPTGGRYPGGAGGGHHGEPGKPGAGHGSIGGALGGVERKRGRLKKDAPA